MSQFKYLEALKVEGRTARHTIHVIAMYDKSPTLIVKPASEANKPYFNALLKRAHSYAVQMQANKLTESMVAENREEDRDLYSKHVIVGWEDVVDDKGKKVEFSTTACADFVKALPSWVFDDVRSFCSKPMNFIAESADAIDAEGTAKN